MDQAVIVVVSVVSQCIGPDTMMSPGRVQIFTGLRFGFG